MGKNNRGGSSDDERVGRPANGVPLSPTATHQAGPVDQPEEPPFEGGEPLLPIVDGDELPEDEPLAASPQQMAQKYAQQYTRDDSERGLDEREHQEREFTDDERLELFRMSMFQNQLPILPDIPGHHLCWLTTTNPRDSIHGRLQLGYKLVTTDDVPGWEHAALTSGQYAGCIGVNEMLAAKLPLRLYELYMTEAHHNQPLAEEGKLRATLDAIKEQAGKGVSVIPEEGTAALGKPRRPRFEGLAARR